MLEACLLSLVCLAGILVVMTAFLVVFSRSRPLSSAVAFGILATFSLLSAGIQLLLFFHVPGGWPWIAGVVVLAAIRVLVANRRAVREAWGRVRNFWAQHPLGASFLGLVFVLLGLQAFLFPPGNHDTMTYHLTRVMLMLQEATLHFEWYSTLRQVLFPYGFDLLHLPFLWFGSDFGLGTPSFLCFAGVCCATYALCAGRGGAAALLTAAFVAAFPEFVLQATSTKNDIACAFAAVMAILAAKEFRERRNLESVCLYGLAMAFGLVSKNYFPLFAGPFTLLLAIDFLWHGRLGDFHARWTRTTLLATVLAGVLLLLWGDHLRSNTLRYGGPFGADTYVSQFRNKDGLRGAEANVLRYALQATGTSAVAKKTAVSLHNRILGNDKAAGALFAFGDTVNGSLMPHEDLEWFGLVGTLCAMVSLGICLFGRGLAFERLVALSLVLYVAALCSSIAWMPWNGRFFTLPMVACGTCLAVFVSRLGPFLRRALWGYLALSLVFTMLFNKQKPLLDPDFLEMLGTFKISGNALSPLVDREYYNDRWVGTPGFMKRYARRIPKGARVLVWAEDGSWVFPFLFRAPGAHFTVAGPNGNTELRVGETVGDTRTGTLPAAIHHAFDFLLVLSPAHHPVHMRDFEKYWTVVERAPWALLMRPNTTEERGGNGIQGPGQGPHSVFSAPLAN